jgi:hypothetical protein
LPDAADDVVDIGERLGGLLAVDHDGTRYVPVIARVATSAAITDIAAGALTIPM